VRSPLKGISFIAEDDVSECKIYTLMGHGQR
jgi:hypothetical protein